MRSIYESFLVLSPALITISATAVASNLSVASASVAVGTTALLVKAAKEVFY